jgi:hypothetical protein
VRVCERSLITRGTRCCRGSRGACGCRGAKFDLLLSGPAGTGARWKGRRRSRMRPALVTRLLVAASSQGPLPLQIDHQNEAAGTSRGQPRVQVVASQATQPARRTRVCIASIGRGQMRAIRTATSAMIALRTFSCVSGVIRGWGQATEQQTECPWTCIADKTESDRAQSLCSSPSHRMGCRNTQWRLAPQRTSVAPRW